MLAEAALHLSYDATRASVICCCRISREVSGTACPLDHQGRECAACLIANRKPYLSAVSGQDRSTATPIRPRTGTSSSASAPPIRSDIFGDGLNVAARLAALAEPGGICFLRTVPDQIRDTLFYAFEDMGEQTIKNIARPVCVYAMKAAAVTTLPPLIAPGAAQGHTPPREPATGRTAAVDRRLAVCEPLERSGSGNGQALQTAARNVCASGPFEAAHVALSSAATGGHRGT
jgi:hypothetical protein